MTEVPPAVVEMRGISVEFPGVKALDSVDVTGEVGLRYVSGLSPIDGLQGTSLEDINDNSSRWALPLSFGIRVRF